MASCSSIFPNGTGAQVFLLAGMMKHHRVTPDATTYMVLLNTCYSAREIHAAEAVWEDIDATGTVLDQAMYDGLLSNPHLNPGQSQRNVPLLLLYFWKVVRLSGPPDVAMMNSIIKIICSFSHPRLACDIVDCHRQWYEGTKRAWDIIMSFKATPDEGLCLQVANVAARAGDSAFVSAVLEALSQKGIRWEEWHFAPLVEAFARSSNIQEAFSVIAIIRRTQSCWNRHGIALMLSNSRNSRLTLSSFTFLLSGALAQRDLQRAIALFQNFESYGHKPDLHTFNLLLKACVEMDQIDLGKGLAQAMDQAGILPSDESYEHLIALSLAQQSTFDRAFNYLREMDDKNVFVSNRLYELLVDRLIDAGDRRWKVAHQTLLERGLSPVSISA
ncbi:hypothetical protein DL96DRAFT_1815640 [Flagelloscypha sp. PMI_526]|nr:hypothetical protein DL96DRAFT_1815640 [Flagelloscypha sp. PMI_526]